MVAGIIVVEDPSHDQSASGNKREQIRKKIVDNEDKQS
jgi:hypothetical protein